MKLSDLFGKKSVKCARCGAEFEKGPLSGETLCESCNWEAYKEEQKRTSIQLQQEGIKEYYKNMPKPFKNMPADIATIMAERDRVLEKYRRSDVISDDDFRAAYSNTGIWNEDECMAFIRRVNNALILTNKRMSFEQGKFIISHEYDGVVVDFDDVFAVAIVRGNKPYTTELENSYLCAMFTNNPYFPAIGMAFSPELKKGIFTSQNKVDDQAVEILSNGFNVWCGNLTYPVMGIKELKKLVKQEGSVRGSMSMEMMKALMSCAEECNSPFWGIDSTMPAAMPFGIARNIAEYGYLSVGDLNDKLMLEKRAEKFWMYYIDKCDREKAESMKEII